MAHAAHEGHLVLLEAHPGPPAVAQAAPGQLGLDVLDGHRQARGQSLDHDHEGRAVRLASGEEPEHLANLLGDRISPIASWRAQERHALVGAPRRKGFSPG